MTAPTQTPPYGVASLSRDQRPAISANEMRRLAEKADGLRDFEPILVVDSEGNVDVVKAVERRPDQQPLVDLKTPNRGQGLSQGAGIRLVLGTRTIGENTDLSKADAVFVSQSAIEKFVLPYYMRFMSPQKVEELAKEMFNDSAIIAGHHLPGSSYGFDRIHTVSIRPNSSDLQFAQF